MKFHPLIKLIHVVIVIRKMSDICFKTTNKNLQLKTLLIPAGLTTTQTDAIYGFGYDAGRIFKVDLCNKHIEHIVNMDAVDVDLSKTNVFNPFYAPATPSDPAAFGLFDIPSGTDMMFFTTNSNRDQNALFTYFFDKSRQQLYIIVPYSGNTYLNSLLLNAQSTASVTTAFPFKIYYY